MNCLLKIGDSNSIPLIEINYIRVILFSMYEKNDTTQNECIFSINYSIVNFDLMQKYLFSVKENPKKKLLEL